MMKRPTMAENIQEYSERYLKARKKEKAEILDEFVRFTNYNRSYASFLLRGRRHKLKGRRSSKRGRKVKYDRFVYVELVKIWEVMDYACGKRLRAIMDEVVDNMIRNGHMSLSEELRLKLHQISASTIDRMLKPRRKGMELRKRSHTKPGTLLKKNIMIRTHYDWDDTKPGYVEIDLVGHSGGNASGDFCYSLNMVDVATGWSVVAALKNKAQVWTLNALIQLRRELPFRLLGIHSDNGSEFINDRFLTYCKENNLRFTRTRTNNKNDNCYVEQRNWTVVRNAVGYYRYDTQEELKMLEKLYALLNIYNNHFQPTQKLTQKINKGYRISRRYDDPLTPYERVLNSPYVDQKKKDGLRKQHEALDIYKLNRMITRLQEHLVDIQIVKSKGGTISVIPAFE